MNKQVVATKTVLSVKNLKKYFPVRKGILKRVVGYVKAVDDISFDIKKGETLGLVGESGCGKTTTGRVILHLLKPTAGEVYYEGKSVASMLKENPKKVRESMQIIFQDPYGSLNPRLTVREIVGEAVRVHNIVSPKEIDDYLSEILSKVGLRPEHRFRYPHEFSGGQRQRICIARALAVKPSFIVCDEPVSALDVSIQSQVLNLLCDLQEEFNLTYLFISHDLSVVKHLSDTIAVMYLGKIVEIAPKKEFFDNPLHPYTEALLSAVPIPDPDRKRKRIILEGDVPSPMNPPSGCRFHTRCNRKMDICSQQEPPLKEIADNHFVACHLY